MPDRDSTDKNAARKPQPPKDDSGVPQDPEVGDQQTDSTTQKSTTSRPRGHTEDPDRTL